MTTLFRSALQAFLLCSLGGLSPASATTLVLVPENEPSTALDLIVAGIRDTTRDIDVRAVVSVDLPLMLGTADPAYEAVIVLGQALLRGSPTLAGDVPILLGGFTGAIETTPGLGQISLNIDPDYVLDQLQKTGPPLARIWTVLPPGAITTPEVMKLASLDGVAITNLAFARGERETARAWFETLENAGDPDDVLWIVDDRHLDESGTYRYLLETAWRRDLLVVSTIPSYARRGVAIGFIPDLSAYGELLARSVRRMIDDAQYTPDPLLGGDTVQRVFNRRTLEHVGRRLPTDLDRTGRVDILIE